MITYPRAISQGGSSASRSVYGIMSAHSRRDPRFLPGMRNRPPELQPGSGS